MEKKDLRLMKRFQSLGSKRVTIVFKKDHAGRTPTLWAKSFRNKDTADRAVKGIESKTRSKIISFRKSKGFNYGAIIKRANK